MKLKSGGVSMWSFTALLFQTLIFVPVNIILTLFSRWQIIGKKIVEKEIRENGSVIFGVVPHTTYFDVFPVPASFRKILPLRFIASVRFFKNPLINFLFRLMGAIPAEGSHGDILEGCLDKGARVANKENLLVFTQGRFQKGSKFLKIHRGVINIAQLSGKPIIPTVFLGTINFCDGKVICFHKDWRFYLGLRKWNVVYGEPIYVQKFGDEKSDKEERDQKYNLFQEEVKKMLRQGGVEC